MLLIVEIDFTAPLADIAASSIETVDVFLLFNRGSSDDSKMRFLPFKRKNRISIFLHVEPEKWRQSPTFFRPPGSERNGTII